MKAKSIILYGSIIALDCFLLFPVIYSYGYLAPIHILIYWLTFDRILSMKTFSCSWNKNIFALIPFISHLMIILIFFFGEESSRAYKGIIELLSNILCLILMVVVVTEFFILREMYSKFQKKRNVKNGS